MLALPSGKWKNLHLPWLTFDLHRAEPGCVSNAMLHTPAGIDALFIAKNKTGEVRTDFHGEGRRG